MANAIEQLDAQVAQLLASWNIYTTLIALVLAAFIFYPLLFWEDADTHPLLLARQAQPSPVRHPRESATYRSVEVPYGYPLRTGLNVKDPGAPRWSAGRDGDLRDIWREVLRDPAAVIMTVHGKEAAHDHDLAHITRAINIIGDALRSAGGSRVAIYLPNSVEYLAAVFACAFYGLSPVLVPFNQPQETAFNLLRDAQADILIASAGSLPLVSLAKAVPDVRQVIWVVEKSGRHMDWNGAPDDADGKLAVAVWHDLVDNAPAGDGTQLPENDNDKPPANIITFWQKKIGGPAETVEFTHKNLVSAIGALLSALPKRQRLEPSDLVLPADSFSHSFVLCWTMAALLSHASLAINSVAGPGVDLALASRGVSPTVVIAASETLASLHTAAMGGITNTFQKMAHMSQSQTMSSGRMPTDNLLFKLIAPSNSTTGNKPGKLRLILVSDRAGTESPGLSSSALSDLRIITRSRICYALTAAPVAGAVAQTNIYDYRSDAQPGSSHFGAPLSSVEVKLINQDDAKLDGSTPTGEIVVSGPAVAGGQAHLGVQGRFREDCTLAYA